MRREVDPTLVKWYLDLKRKSCKKRHIEFALSFISVFNMWSANHDFYTGQKLTNENTSIDRVNNSKGYIPGNVVACTKKCNVSKGNISVEEIILAYNHLQETNEIMEFGRGIKLTKQLIPQLYQGLVRKGIIDGNQDHQH